MKNIIELLIKRHKTVSTMESCTGGFLANSLTNIEGASEVFKFGAVTYSNEYKIKMGVKESLINKYSVYSEQVAESMARSISIYTNSDYGIGITGKLKKKDKNNLTVDDNKVFCSIYSSKENKYYNSIVNVDKTTREDNKKYVVDLIIKDLREVILNEKD